MTAEIFNIQRFCVNDGPGIRTTVFFKGCNLRCAWCHNPESQSVSKQILFYSEKCTHCGRCKEWNVNNSDFFCANEAKEICGKTFEINTKTYTNHAGYIPKLDLDILKRFKELGGEIVTIGSDAHDITRIGQYSKEALEIVKDIFGYVCTFENRKPIFHKL